MKTKPSTNKDAHSRSANHDARIDAALRVYAGAVPAPGLESRVAARISAAPRRSFRAVGSARLIVLRGFSAGALAAAAACAMVVGTVRHSQQIPLPQRPGAPGSGSILSGASRVPTKAASPAATLDPLTPRAAPRSRATVSPNQARKPSGASAHGSPYAAASPSAPRQ